MVIQVPNRLLKLGDLWDREEEPSDDCIREQYNAQ